MDSGPACFLLFLSSLTLFTFVPLVHTHTLSLSTVALVPFFLFSVIFSPCFYAGVSLSMVIGFWMSLKLLVVDSCIVVCIQRTRRRLGDVTANGRTGSDSNVYYPLLY